MCINPARGVILLCMFISMYVSHIVAADGDLVANVSVGWLAGRIAPQFLFAIRFCE